MDLNWDNLKGLVKGEIITIFDEEKYEISADLKDHAARISASLVRTASQGKTALSKELKLQLQSLAEIHAIRTTKKTMGALERVLGVVMRTIAAAIV